MASTFIHLAIAKKVLEEIPTDNERDYYLGAIAPDISKQIGQSKEISHFLINSQENIPNIPLFIKRYPNFLKNSFELGYFTHLYTDKCWNNDFLKSILSTHSIELLDGTSIQATKEEIKELIFSDYTNLNKKIIEEHNLDLSLFKEDFQVPNTTFEEVPINQLDILLNKIKIILENSKEEKNYTLDINIINNFITETSQKIIQELKKY